MRLGPTSGSKLKCDLHMTGRQVLLMSTTSTTCIPTRVILYEMFLKLIIFFWYKLSLDLIYKMRYSYTLFAILVWNKYETKTKVLISFDLLGDLIELTIFATKYKIMS